MMMQGIEKEVFIFLHAILTGIIIYLVYSVLRLFRRIVKHNLFWVSVEDLIYWVYIGFYVFFQIYQTSSGIIRWYFVLGTFLGGIITHGVISKILTKYIDNSKKRE